MNQKTYKTIFFGTPDFALPVLQTLVSLPFIELKAVVTQPDKPVGRSKEPVSPPVKAWATKHNLAVWQPESLKNKEFLDQFRSANPELCIVVAYGKIIPANFLGIPTHSWLNVHASLLPKHRGASPIQAAILNGEEDTGVTLMKIDAGLDTGPIIEQTKIRIDSLENFKTLHDRLARLGSVIVKNSLLPYLTGQLQPKIQNDALATLTKIITKEDGRIDWNKSADEIDRQIRAFTPWPGAYCFWTSQKTNGTGTRLKIISASLVEHEHQLLPGQTLYANKTLLVGCGQGCLSLNKLQQEGKRPLQASEFILGCAEIKHTKLS